MRRTKDVPFLNNAGGINEATSPFQMAVDECQACLNVYFEKYGEWGIVAKRKGYTLINDVAMDGKVLAIKQFYISQTSYLHAFTDAGKAYLIDISAGTATELQSGLTTTKNSRFATLGDKAYMVNSDDGLMESTGGVWTAVADANKPTTPVDVCVYDGRLFVINSTTLYWSTVGDGSDWTTDSSNMGVDEDDGDICTAITTLSNQLIAFKKRSLHRITYTGDETIPYRRTPQYSGVSGQGIGTASANSIQAVVIENLYSDVYGKADYLIFMSDQGIHALGIQGNPSSIEQRVKETYNNISKNRLNACFSVWHPKRSQYIVFYPQGSKFTSSDQLVFHTKAKAFSKYDFNNMTASAAYIDLKSTYVLLGDKDGYLYRHDWQDFDDLDQYNDNGVAISAYWQSQFFDFGVPNKYKQLYNCTVRTKETETDCPVIVTVTAENSLSTTGTISTTTANGTGGRYDTAIVGTNTFASALGYLDKDLDVPLYCYNAAFRFSNDTINQQMFIYGWFIEMKPTGNKGAR